MIQNSHRKQIAVQLIRNSYQSLAPYLEQGKHVWNCTSDLAVAAVLLDEGEIFTPLFDLIKNAPEEHRWHQSAFEREKIEKRFPVYQEPVVIEIVREYAKFEPHLALTLEHRYADAISFATVEGIFESERMLEEIACTQAILGDFEAALYTIQHPLAPEFRKRGAFTVLVIELFRRDKFDQAHDILRTLDSSAQDVWSHAWEHIQIAVSLIGRFPWAGYPYPDW